MNPLCSGVGAAGDRGKSVSGEKVRRRHKGPRWWRRLRYMIEYAALRFVGFVMRLLPMDTASGFMGWCWRMMAPRLRRHPRALAHLALAYPEKSAAERERIALAMWTNLGRVFAESFFVERLLASGRIEDRVAPLLETLKSSHRGIVFVSAHYGNWELAITPTMTAGIKAAGVYQRVKNDYVEALLMALRRERYPRGLFAKGTDIARRLMRVAREGGAVAMLADLRDRGGLPVPFFGRLAPSTNFPAALCRSTDAALVAARVIRVKGARFIIEAEVIQVPRTDDRDADIAETTRRIQSKFEGWIREYPDHWMWAHRRWG